MICQHCKQDRENTRRGLCRPCYRRPEVRALYPERKRGPWDSRTVAPKALPPETQPPRLHVEDFHTMVEEASRLRRQLVNGMAGDSRERAVARLRALVGTLKTARVKRPTQTQKRSQALWAARCVGVVQACEWTLRRAV